MEDSFVNHPPRIIFVSGIATTAYMFDSLQEFLSERYPDRELVFISSIYGYIEHKKILAIQDELHTLLSDGIPSVLVGHSFGGIIAVATFQKYQHDLDCVVKIVTLGTPHRLDLFGLGDAKSVLGYTYQPIEIPIYTVGAKQDIVVLPKYTHFPNSEHRLVTGKHEDFLYPENPWTEDFWSLLD